jgi:hypothetical protein
MTTRTGEDSGELLTIQELSANSRLSVSTLHRLKRQGRIPYCQPSGKGGKLWFPADAIERCMCLPSAPEPTTPESDHPTQTCLSGPVPTWMSGESSRNKESK